MSTNLVFWKPGCGGKSKTFMMEDLEIYLRVMPRTSSIKPTTVPLPKSVQMKMTLLSVNITHVLGNSMNLETLSLTMKRIIDVEFTSESGRERRASLSIYPTPHLKEDMFGSGMPGSPSSLPLVN